jgi:hypothetical protein
VVFSLGNAIALVVARWLYRPTFDPKVVSALLGLVLLGCAGAAAVFGLDGRQARLDEASIASVPIRDAVLLEKRRIGDGPFGESYRLSVRFADSNGAQRSSMIDVDAATFARATMGQPLRVAKPDARGERIIVVDATSAAKRVRDLDRRALIAVLGAICAGAGLIGMWLR